MWRAFGGTTSRVALVFRPPAITEAVDFLQVQMRPVLYNAKSEVHAALDVVTTGIEVEADFFRSLGEQGFVLNVVSAFIGLVVGLKHGAFAEEKEWRIIHLPKMRPSPNITKNVESIRGTPQIVYRFPIGSDPDPRLQSIAFTAMFERLIVGPTGYAWSLYEAFVEVLENAGIEDAQSKVFASGIPLR